MYNKEYYQKYYQKNKERIRERNKKNREHILQYNRSWRLKVKVEALTYYGGGKPACVRCGFSDIRALSIDHIQGGGTHRRSLINKRLALWLKQQGYPEGYQTLCMNCQFVKREEEQECLRKVKDDYT